MFLCDLMLHWLKFFVFFGVLAVAACTKGGQEPHSPSADNAGSPNASPNPTGGGSRTFEQLQQEVQRLISQEPTSEVGQLAEKMRAFLYGQPLTQARFFLAPESFNISSVTSGLLQVYKEGKNANLEKYFEKTPSSSHAKVLEPCNRAQILSHTVNSEGASLLAQARVFLNQEKKLIFDIQEKQVQLAGGASSAETTKKKKDLEIDLIRLRYATQMEAIKQHQPHIEKALAELGANFEKAQEACQAYRETATFLQNFLASSQQSQAEKERQLLEEITQACTPTPSKPVSLSQFVSALRIAMIEYQEASTTGSASLVANPVTRVFYDHLTALATNASKVADAAFDEHKKTVARIKKDPAFQGLETLHQDQTHLQHLAFGKSTIEGFVWTLPDFGVLLAQFTGVFSGWLRGTHSFKSTEFQKQRNQFYGEVGAIDPTTKKAEKIARLFAGLKTNGAALKAQWESQGVAWLQAMQAVEAGWQKGGSLNAFGISASGWPSACQFHWTPASLSQDLFQLWLLGESVYVPASASGGQRGAFQGLSMHQRDHQELYQNVLDFYSTFSASLKGFDHFGESLSAIQEEVEKKEPVLLQTAEAVSELMSQLQAKQRIGGFTPRPDATFPSSGASEFEQWLAGHPKRKMALELFGYKFGTTEYGNLSILSPEDRKTALNKQYRTLSRLKHPDKPWGSVEAFQELESMKAILY